MADSTVMTMRDRLRADRVETPNWLRDCPEFDGSIGSQMLEGRTVFYPGSGSDHHPVDLFGRTHAAHAFILADYDTRAEPRSLPGYKIAVMQVLDFETLVAELDLEPKHPYPSRWTRMRGWAEIKSGLSLWVVYRRETTDEAIGPERLAVLHAHGEAVWLYWNLWVRAGEAPYGVVLQDHGFGGNWARFGGAEAPLFEVARGGPMPEWLLVARNTPAWPGYLPAFDDAETGVPFGAMHDHERRLFRRSDAAP